MAVPVVEACGLTKLYGERVPALVDLDLRVEPGEWLTIMGPSGSGKTTLLNLLGCLDQPTRGRLSVAGVETSGLSEGALSRLRRTQIGLVFQHFYLVPYLTALENVMLAQYFHSLADAHEARLALERVGLAERLNHRPSQLSGGEQQRVCVARALVNQPALILADEPTGNLDEANEEIVLDLLGELHHGGHTLVVVTHDPAVAERADRRVRLEHGRLVRPEGSMSARDGLARSPVAAG